MFLDNTFGYSSAAKREEDESDRIVGNGWE
jgi:hypothetical protein